MKRKERPKIKMKRYILTDFDEVERFFDKMDRVWNPYFGKQCPEFYPLCPQCKFALIYNKFKQDVFDEVLG